MIIKETFFQMQTTVDSDAEAESLARALIKKRLAACVQIVPRIRSVYEWRGTVDVIEELLILIKTTGSNLDAVTDYLEKQHSYEVPEIIALPIEGITDSYAKWIVTSTN